MPTPAPDSSQTGDLSLDEYRSRATALVEWIATYLEHPERYPVLPPLEPGATLAALADEPPEEPEPLGVILDDFNRQIVPRLTHWNHPGFLAYFANTASVPGMLGEMLATALNTNAMLWRTGPAAAELEERTTDWMRQLIGLPPEWFGMITDLASTSTLYALAAARELDPALDVRRKGLSGRALPALRVYCSDQAHSSVHKAAMTLGIGLDNVVAVESDAEFRMRPEALERAIASDRAAGHRPIAVVGVLGTTSSTSVDPLAAIADIATREQIWFHVDAAYAGVAGAVPELRHHFAGMERADSVVINPHKWLFTPMDCSVFLVRRPEALRRAFSVIPAYLETAEQDTVTNYMDYGFQLGHRFRALKLWMVIRAFGARGIATRIRHHCALAAEFAGWVAAAPGWAVEAPHPFSVVCFRHVIEGDESRINEHNARILDLVNASGDVFLSHTVLRGRYVIRVAVGNLRTERSHLARAWELLRTASATS
ncbi:MAG: pyridoxal-dependent decarboxylase [Gemmatimonadetes bacterium]|nr:pyridoxal-dependent decarboxylase [Gemmatimonadota bacterium]